jgi:hypothetical protein
VMFCLRDGMSPRCQDVFGQKGTNMWHRWMSDIMASLDALFYFRFMTFQMSFSEHSFTMFFVAFGCDENCYAYG